MRKSFFGLNALTANVLKERPESGGLFVFTNQRRNRVKVLYWDGTGFWVMTKRLERGTFSWPVAVGEHAGKMELRPEALALLLDGVDYLLTWKCRHLDNAEMKPVMRSVCTVHGYVCPEICTPLELMGDEDEG